MLAERIMVTELVTAQENECVGEVLSRMRKASLRMLPVLDQDHQVVGIFSTTSILSYIVPDYIVSGDLDQVSYAPDMGVLHKGYDALADHKVSTVMEDKPLLISPEDSLLSVAASLVSLAKHEYAVVVDKQRRILGVISSGDLLDFLSECSLNEYDDA